MEHRAQAKGLLKIPPCSGYFREALVHFTLAVSEKGILI